MAQGGSSSGKRATKRSIDRLVRRTQVYASAHERVWYVLVSQPARREVPDDPEACTCNARNPVLQGAAYYRCGINFNFAQLHHLRCCVREPSVSRLALSRITWQLAGVRDCMRLHRSANTCVYLHDIGYGTRNAVTRVIDESRYGLEKYFNF